MKFWSNSVWHQLKRDKATFTRIANFCLIKHCFVWTTATILEKVTFMSQPVEMKFNCNEISDNSYKIRIFIYIFPPHCDRNFFHIVKRILYLFVYYSHIHHRCEGEKKRY